MKRVKKQINTGFISLPKTATSELRGKQSVRATFKLTQKSIDAMSIVSVHLGIKQKSLFDHLMSDIDALNIIADELQSLNLNRRKSIQKTYVLSRNTLSLLDAVSKNFSASRDSLVEFSIQRLMPIITKEQEKHRKRKEIMDNLNHHLKEGYKIIQKSQKLLGKDDPVYHKIASAVAGFEKSYIDIEAYIEKCEIIENF